MHLCRVRLRFKWLQDEQHIYGPAHTWEGLQACTYGLSGLHGLQYKQLKPHNSGEQIRPKPVPEQAGSSRITFTLYGLRFQLVWCTVFPWYVAEICLSRLEMLFALGAQFGEIDCL